MDKTVKNYMIFNLDKWGVNDYKEIKIKRYLKKLI